MPSFVAVFGGIGIDQERGGSQAFGGERFESAIAVGIGISHQHDFPAHIDAVLAQVVVVFRIAAVRVDDRRGNFSRSRIAEIRAGHVWDFSCRDRHRKELREERRDSAWAATISSEISRGEEFSTSY